MHLLVLHGPISTCWAGRDPVFYGTTSLEQINQGLAERAAALGSHSGCFRQPWGELVDRIQQGVVRAPALDQAGGLHPHSIALVDALLAVSLPSWKPALSKTPMPGSRAATPPPWRLWRCGCDLRLWPHQLPPPRPRRASVTPARSLITKPRCED